MELMIFGTVNLIAIAIFAALTALPFYLLYLVGSGVGRRIRFPAIRWLLPAATFGLLSLWVVASVTAFQHACQSAPAITVLTHGRYASPGFALQEARSDRFAGMEYNWDGILQSGAFQFVDAGGRRHCVGKKEHERQREFPIISQCDTSLRSGLLVAVLPHQPSGEWWSPPISEAVIEVRDADTNQVLAKATDVIFGGGVVGKYLRLLGGDQDFERLSCGYASPGIGPWRPTLSSRVRSREYREADLKLIKGVLGQP